MSSQQIVDASVPPVPNPQFAAALGSGLNPDASLVARARISLAVLVDTCFVAFVAFVAFAATA
jgi:hypothetical protein